ncbi:hypothetical protein Aperf_G00000021559 [Anoplocephala perfoliata]
MSERLLMVVAKGRSNGRCLDGGGIEVPCLLYMTRVFQHHHLDVCDGYKDGTYANQHNSHPSYRSHQPQQKYPHPLHQQQLQQPYHHFSCQRSRPRPPPYEMGDEDIVSRMRNGQRGPPQWTVVAPTTPPPPTQTVSITQASKQSVLSKREKTPGSQSRNAFFISSRDNYFDRSAETRQSCPPLSNPRQAYVGPNIEGGRGKRYISTMGTTVYHSGSSIYHAEYTPRYLNQPHKIEVSIQPNMNHVSQTRMSNASATDIFD